MEKLISLRRKLKGAAGVLSMFSGGGFGGGEAPSAEADTRDRLREFQVIH